MTSRVISENHVPSVASYTLGCKVNQYETDAIVQGFLKRGYRRAEEGEAASVYILNTCTVTGEAGRKSGQLLRRARKNNPRAILVAMGCHIQLGGFADVADIIVGTQGKTLIYNAVKLFDETWAKDDYQASFRPPLIDLTTNLALNNVPDYEELGIVDDQEETRAYIKVQDGCNQFCSFCTIPYARGRVRSRSVASVVEEAKALVKKGYLEVVVTGIHVCSYGQDLDEFKGKYKRQDGALALMDLIDELAKIEGLWRIRLGSLEPLSISEEFILRAAKQEKLCPHFHLSLQSGSDATLRRMRRRYNSSQFMNIVNNLKKAYGKNLALTTDVIVGFPGETEEEFKETYEFCKQVNFSRMHIFRYSERKNTAAVNYENKVDAVTSSQRAKVLGELSQSMQIARQRALIGKRAKLILEQKNRDGFWEGYTDLYDSVTLKPLFPS